LSLQVIVIVRLRRISRSIRTAFRQIVVMPSCRLSRVIGRIPRGAGTCHHRHVMFNTESAGAQGGMPPPAHPGIREACGRPHSARICTTPQKLM